MRAPVFLCPCTSIGTSPLQPVLPPPPAGSFPLQPALLRRSWPSFDPLPVFCGLSMPSLCSLLALSVLPSCPFLALPCSLRVFSVLFPCPFLTSSLLSPCPFHDLLPIPLKGGEPPPRAFCVMCMRPRRRYIGSRSSFSGAPSMRFSSVRSSGIDARRRTEPVFFRSGPTSSYRPAASFLSVRACCFIHIHGYFGLKMPK